MQTIAIPKPTPEEQLAAGFNPFNLTRHEVGEDYGWNLLPEGEFIQPGDGYWHPDASRWVAYECRPDLFRGEPNEHVHTWPWRRLTAPQPANPT